MPKVTVYVRTEDYDKWKHVEKKTDFISRALNGAVSSPAKPRGSNETPVGSKEARRTVDMSSPRCKIHGVPKDICKLMKH